MLVDTGRTARTRGQLDLTVWPEKCDISVRKSRSEIPEREREKFFVCRYTRVTASLIHGGNVPPCAVRGCGASGALHGRSGQWRRAVLPVAERVLSAEVC